MPWYVFNRKKLADTGITMHERDQKHPALFQCTMPDDLTIVKVDDERQHIVRGGVVIAHIYVHTDGSQCQGYLRIL